MSDFEFSDSDNEDLCTDINLLKCSFNKAADHVQIIHKKITHVNLLQLYAYYKQATLGSCNTTKPRFLQVQDRSKWNAWNSLGDMPKFEAMEKYVKLLEQLDPIWHKEMITEIQQNFKQIKTPLTGWVVHSTLQHTKETIDEHNKTPFDYVREGNLGELEKYISAQRTHVVKELIQQKDENGMGLVHWATDRNHPHVLEYLLQIGASVNIRDNEEQTPLHYASSCGHYDCISILLKNNADSLIYDSDKNTCIDVAENAEIRSILLKHSNL